MELNNYQDKAMTTCLASCKNEVYAINGLQAEVGEIADKVGKFVEGQVIDVESTYPRRVEILRVEARQAEDISDKEWKDMGCVWTADFVKRNVQELALLENGLSMKDEVGLYWYKEVSVE